MQKLSVHPRCILLALLRRRVQTGRGVDGAAYRYLRNPWARVAHGGALEGAPLVPQALWQPARPLDKRVGLVPLCLRSARVPGLPPGPLGPLPAPWLPALVLHKRPGPADPLLRNPTRWPDV